MQKKISRCTGVGGNMTTKLVNHISIDNDVLAKILIERYMDLYAQFTNLLMDLDSCRLLFIKNKKIYLDFEAKCILPQLDKYYANSSTDLMVIREHYGYDLEWQTMNLDVFKRAICWAGSPFVQGTMIKTLSGVRRIGYISDASNDNGGYWVEGFDIASIAPSSLVFGNLVGVSKNYNQNDQLVIPHVPLEFSLDDMMYEDVLNYLVKNDLMPKGLDEDEEEIFNLLVKLYPEAVECDTAIDAILNLTDDDFVKYSGEFKISQDVIEDMLLNGDKKRAAHQSYSERILTDANQGHWDLWDGTQKEANTKIALEQPMYARDPASSVVDGVVGIDFGTKSTVVVHQKDSLHTLPMRVGITDLTKKVERFHYENPTYMQFKKFESFYSDYTDQQCRPHTDWEDLIVSHSALNAVTNASTSDNYSSFFSELKYWAGTKGVKAKIIDTEGHIIDLPPYEAIEEIDPIEIYAYFLGLNINNLHNGLYLDYYLSFPVTYEVAIREKLAKSFERGIRKSLPQSLLDNDTIMDKLKVHMGASEPAAYAVTALQEYGFEPEDDEKIAYGVFDFGGGTTDFDFGIWREATGKKERRYDYVVEHFGAGGDKYLGGENILQLLAYHIVEKNSDLLRKLELVFSKPPETKEFIGSEVIIRNSREAKLNMTLLSERLRPLWERHENYESQYLDSIKLNLFNVRGETKTAIRLDVDIEELEAIIEQRIEKGVINFFESIRLAFYNNADSLSGVDRINIFLAGNSSKSEILLELLDRYVEKETKKILDINEIHFKDDYVFKVFPPLGTEDSNKMMESLDIDYISDSLEKPTGKTGVAFGLIECRKGSKIKIVDKNVNEEIHFKYYLGEIRKNKFKVIVDRSRNYNEWIEFIDAGVEDFEIFYTDLPSASTNKLIKTDESVKVKRLDIDTVDEDYSVYIRLISPTAIEYVVSDEQSIETETYHNEIRRVEFG